MFGAVDSDIESSGAYEYGSWWTAPQPSEVSLADFTANLTSIVQQILNAGKNVTLLTPWPKFSTAGLNQGRFYSDAVKGVGANFGIPVLDAGDIMRKLWWGSDQWLAARIVPNPNAPSLWSLIEDELHPSALGHTYIANLCALPQAFRACACHG